MNQIVRLTMTDLPDDRAAPQVPTWRAEDLTQGGTQARIVLGDQVYHLRITRLGKLILTK